ncbi:hypothetical protein [Nocardia gipuzkoensis]|uniref:hypothetical protein n=1 Tax=Nocardia gipuzkoensis TaxID=2749991 RepID=UPI00237E7D35|nr:hypothetical protein [Nocardia gipuzkoensis]MDE1674337.1 hypothetical protein [Nocardia gipuzkoensis]
MTSVLAFATADPGFYAVGAHAPEVADRTLRECHADISLILAVAVEAVRAKYFDQHERAAALASYAEALLPTEPGQAARIYRAELSAVRAELAGDTPDPQWGAYASTYTDSCARAQAREAALRHQLHQPHPAIRELLLRTVGEATEQQHGPAVQMLREHLISYGIDPTDPAAVAAIEQRRRDGKTATRPGATGHLVYLGELVGPGVYTQLDTTTPLAELVDADRALSWEESRVLLAARVTDPEVFAGRWLPTLARLLDRWISRIPAGA